MKLTPRHGETSCCLKLESRNSTGSFHDREVRGVLSNVKQPTLRLSASPPLALSIAAHAAAAHIPVTLHLLGRTPNCVMAELLTYGAEISDTPYNGLGSLIASEEDRRRGLAQLAHELVADLDGVAPDLILLPKQESFLQLTLQTALARDGSAPRFLEVDWQRSRAEAFAVATQLARDCGLLVGLSAGAALATLSSLDVAGLNVVVLDCYAPKFFEEYSRFRPESREQSKLGGLITPR